MRQSVVNATTANLLYDGVALVAEYDHGGTLVQRFVHGPGVDEPLVAYEGATTAAKSWLHADHLGSIVGTADATGPSTAVYSDGSFGEPNSTAGQSFRYTGQQRMDTTGLYSGPDFCNRADFIKGSFRETYGCAHPLIAKASTDAGCGADPGAPSSMPTGQ